MSTIIRHHDKFAIDYQVSVLDSGQKHMLDKYEISREHAVVYGVVGSYYDMLRVIDAFGEQDSPLDDLVDAATDRRKVYTFHKKFAGIVGNSTLVVMHLDWTAEVTGREAIILSNTDMPSNAWGSGASYALGALSAGAEISEAMDIASLHDLYTSAQHLVISLATVGG